MVKGLLKLLKKNKDFTKDEAPEGACPNCWGRQEYGGDFYNAVKKFKADNNQQDPQTGWIDKYAEKHLHGIQLMSQEDGYVCTGCKVSYRADS